MDTSNETSIVPTVIPQTTVQNVASPVPVTTIATNPTASTSQGSFGEPTRMIQLTVPVAAAPGTSTMTIPPRPPTPHSSIVTSIAVTTTSTTLTCPIVSQATPPQTPPPSSQNLPRICNLGPLQATTDVKGSTAVSSSIALGNNATSTPVQFTMPQEMERKLTGTRGEHEDSIHETSSANTRQSEDGSAETGRGEGQLQSRNLSPEATATATTTTSVAGSAGRGRGQGRLQSHNLSHEATATATTTTSVASVAESAERGQGQGILQSGNLSPEATATATTTTSIAGSAGRGRGQGRLQSHNLSPEATATATTKTSVGESSSRGRGHSCLEVFPVFNRGRIQEILSRDQSLIFGEYRLRSRSPIFVDSQIIPEISSRTIITSGAGSAGRCQGQGGLQSGNLSPGATATTKTSGGKSATRGRGQLQSHNLRPEATATATITTSVASVAGSAERGRGQGELQSGNLSPGATATTKTSGGKSATRGRGQLQSHNLRPEATATATITTSVASVAGSAERGRGQGGLQSGNLSPGATATTKTSVDKSATRGRGHSCPEVYPVFTKKRIQEMFSRDKSLFGRHQRQSHNLSSEATATTITEEAGSAERGRGQGELQTRHSIPEASNVIGGVDIDRRDKSLFSRHRRPPHNLSSEATATTITEEAGSAERGRGQGGLQSGNLSPGATATTKTSVGKSARRGRGQGRLQTRHSIPAASTATAKSSEAGSAGRGQGQGRLQTRQSAGRGRGQGRLQTRHSIPAASTATAKSSEAGSAGRGQGQGRLQTRQSAGRGRGQHRIPSHDLSHGAPGQGMISSQLRSRYQNHEIRPAGGSQATVTSSQRQEPSFQSSISAPSGMRIHFRVLFCLVVLAFVFSFIYFAHSIEHGRPLMENLFQTARTWMNNFGRPNGAIERDDDDDSNDCMAAQFEEDEN